MDDVADTVDIKDFSFADTVKPFRVSDDVFYPLPDIPLYAMQKLGKFKNIAGAIEEQGLEPLLEVMDLFLSEASAERFRWRVLEDKTDPIGVRRTMAIIPWLMEQYGLRPTQPSSDSFTGSSDGETGFSSTDGVLPEELTLSSSQSIESSTSSSTA